MTRMTGQHAGLSRAHVLETARGLIVDRGLDGLTIRALAEKLGVAPNAVYGWVATKSALLDALADDTFASVNPTSAPSDPIAALRALLLDAYDALLARPDLAPLLLDRRHPPGPHTIRFREDVRTLLETAGASPGVAAAAVSILVVNTLGFVSFVHQTEGAAALLRMTGNPDPRTTFSTGIGWLLTGMNLPGRPTQVTGGAVLT